MLRKPGNRPLSIPNSPGALPTVRSLRRAPFLDRAGWAARLRLFISREVGVATAFLLLNLAFGIFWMGALFALISLGIGLAYTLVGVGILALTMRFWMAGATLERARIAVFCGIRIPAP